MADLTIIIPARNEMFLRKTVEDILAHIEGNTEVIAVVDGPTEYEMPPEDPRVKVIKHEVSTGQRASSNEAARLAQSKYLMKVDAHCAFDQGFDVKMIAEMHDDWTMIPTMLNLHAFDWVCPDGHRRYQGPSGRCTNSLPDNTVCGKETVRELVWKPRKGVTSQFYRFDNTMHFQYWNEFKTRPEAQGDICETLSIQGSCFMITKEKWFELDICSEEFHSWGQQGVEVACKTWLSGGRLVINKKTWYAHMFRTQGGDFSFPYHQPQSEVEQNRELSRKLFTDNQWPKAVHPFSWLLEKFWPVPGWDSIPGSNYIPPPYTSHNSLNLWRFNHRGHYYESLIHGVNKGVVYYTDNRLDPRIQEYCMRQLDRAFRGKIVSVSLQPMDFGQNIVLPLERGYLTMAKQILAGLEAIDTDIVFFCEHDIIYHPSHFDFIPEKKDVYYYNMNSWLLRDDGHCLYFDHKSLSGLCAYRELLLEHYKKRVARIEELIAQGKNPRHEMRFIGFEPGTHHRHERIDDFKAEGYRSEHPNVDIKHGCNLTQNRWSQDQFRDKQSCQNWQESEEIPFWGKGVDIIKLWH
jgi:glycosyltransferase involved in cell wall biosynthesis